MARTPAAAETATRHVGNCQICEGDQKLLDSRMVHHGYRRPGDGVIHGDCPGVGEVPYEVSCDLIKSHKTGLEAMLVGFRKRLRDILEGRVTAPEWLQAAVREAHQGSLPSDWIYAECKAAVEAFDDGSLDDSEDDDSVHAHVDGRVDVYTQGLYQWAADFCLMPTWAAAEQEAEDMGMPDETERRVAAIQYAAIRHIADTMRQACKTFVQSAEPATT